MFKPLIRIIVLLISIGLVGYSGYYIYKKQKFPVGFQSFNNIEGASVLYVPDLSIIGKKPGLLAVLEQENIPEDLINLLSKGAENRTFNEHSAVYAQFGGADYTIVFKGVDPEIFNTRYRTNIDPDSKSIAIGNKVFKGMLKNEFIVLSSQDIHVKDAPGREIGNGNGDFFYSTGCRKYSVL